MTNPRDDRLFSSLSKHRKSPPGGDASGFFSTGQGGRTVLPPLSSAFPTSPPSVSPTTNNNNNSNNYPSYSQHQHRSSPAKIDHGYGQWPSSMSTIQVPQQHSNYYEHYERYPPAQQYPNYPSRSSPTIPPDPHSSRKLPPLSMSDKYQGNYGAVAPHVSNYGDVRSPTATYPTEYTTYQNQTSYSYPPVPDPRHHSGHLPSMHHHSQQPMSIGMYPIAERGMPAHVEAHGPSPYARGMTTTRMTDETLPMLVSEDTAIKKKRKRADAAQLKVLNETYERTAFPSTEERAELAKKLEMSARSVQIWFQNKRQSMRQTTRQSSTSVTPAHQSFNMSPHADDHSSFTTGSISPTAIPQPSYPSRQSQDSRSVTQESRSSHRREEESRKWQQPRY